MKTSRAFGGGSKIVFFVERKNCWVAGFCVRKATFLAAQLQFLSSQASRLVVVASFFLFVPATVFAGFPPVVVGHVAAARRGCPISRRCAPLGPTNRETHRPAVKGKYGGLGPPLGDRKSQSGCPASRRGATGARAVSTIYTGAARNAMDA